MVAVVLAATCAVSASLAAAASRNGITPRGPKDRALVPLGGPLVFEFASRRTRGAFFVSISRSSRRNADGVIRDEIGYGQARRRDGLWRWRVPGDFDFLEEPGTYFWQATLIDCRPDPDDCFREGPVQRFVIGF